MPRPPATFDVRQLVADLGGPTSISALAGIRRTSVYSILRRRRATTDQLAAMKAAFPHLDLNRYIRT